MADRSNTRHGWKDRYGSAKERRGLTRGCRQEEGAVSGRMCGQTGDGGEDLYTSTVRIKCLLCIL